MSVKTAGRKRNSFMGKTSKEANSQLINRNEDKFDDSIIENKNNELKNGKPLYPNCDTTIWLRSCEKEVIDPVNGTTTGQVPKWLSGSLIRNGPGSLKVGNMEFKHLFDSSALLHRFHIKDGKVTYQNRFLQSQTLKKNQRAQRIVVTEFGTSAVPDPCHTIFDRISAVFNASENMSDNAMISVYPIGDELFAMTETPIIHAVNGETLETGMRVNLGTQLGIINHTSHPHVMPDGGVYNLGMTIYSTGPHYCIIHIPPRHDQDETKTVFEKAKIVATVPSRWRFHPSYMHTFGITENYFIIVEQPLSVAVSSVVKNMIMNRPIVNALQWHQKAGTMIYLVNRQTGNLDFTYSTETFFYLHIINQYEQDGHVIIDICCYKDPSMLDCMYISALKEAQHNPEYASMFRGRPLRFVLPLINRYTTMEKGDNINKFNDSQSTAFVMKDGRIIVTPELLCSMGCETPRINYEKYCGKKYRYFYAISSDVDLDNPGTLIKVDTKTRTRKTWGEKNMYPSEPIFVAAPTATDEDDGVIITAVVWGGVKTNHVGIVILDAKSWKEISRTTFVVDSVVPKCLHGWFVQDDKK